MFSYIILLLKFYKSNMERDRYLEHLQNNPKLKAINHNPTKAFLKYNYFLLNPPLITLHTDSKDHLEPLRSNSIPQR